MLSKNKLKTDYACNLKLWPIYLSPFPFYLYEKLV